MVPKRLALLALFWLVGQLGAQVHAQNAASPVGTVAGKVIDKGTGEELPGALIVLPGTTKGASTDLNGKYILKLAPGTYSLKASLLGYQPQEQKIKVTAGQTTLVNWAMSENTQSTSEIEVVAVIKKTSSEFLQIELRNVESVASGLSAEVIKKTPDRTVADAVKRVSGASIQDNKFAVVRGLADRYNLGYLNGVPLPSSEADRKAFSLDLIPSAVLENIIISKTASPDMPGDFAGGLVQINTKEIPYERTLFVQMGGQSHSLTTFRDFRQGTTSGTDWLGYDNGTRGIPAGVLSNDSSRRLRPIAADMVGLVNQSRLFNNQFAPTLSQGRPNLSFQTGYSDRFELGKSELGIIALYNYNNSLRYTPSLFYDPQNFRTPGMPQMRDGDSIAFDQYRVNVINSGILNFTFKLNPSNKFSWKNMINQTSESNNVIRDRKTIANDGQDETWGKDYFYFYQSSRIFNSQFSGEHLVTDWFKLNYTFGYANMLRETPDFKRLYYDSTINKPDADPNNWFTQPTQARLVNYNGFNSFNPVFSSKFFSTLKEDNRTVALNLTFPLKAYNTTIKAGFMGSSRGRSFNGRNFLYGTAANYNPGATSSILKQGPNDIFRSENFSDSTLVMKESTQPSDVYGAASDYHAQYLMLDHKFWGDRVKFIYGARLETYRQRLTSARAGEPVSVDVTWQDLLPSATAIINATDKLVIRANASQTVSRPEFRELAPLAFYEVNYNVIAVGNDTLKRTRITNLDLKAEYYFDNGAMLAVNPFFKYFRDPIETEIRKQSFSLLNYLNTKEATNMGVEFEARLPMAFVDTLFGTSQGRNFSLFGNYAYIFSRVNLETGLGGVPLRERPLQGQSPYLINAGLQYQNEDLGLDAQLSYNHIGRRIVFTNAIENGQVWENPRDLLDLSISQRLYKGLTGRFVMGDILAQPLIWYQDLNLNGRLDETDLRQFQFQNGRTFSVSLNYSF